MRRTDRECVDALRESYGWLEYVYETDAVHLPLHFRRDSNTRVQDAASAACGERGMAGYGFLRAEHADSGAYGAC